MKQAMDIITLPIEINETIADSKFRLVHIASQRVRQLSGGEAPVVASRSLKDTTIALEESLTGTFRVIVGEEAKKAKEEFRKKQEQTKIEEQLSAKEEEIRKELSAYLSESHAEESSEEGALEGEGEEPSGEESEEAGEEASGETEEAGE